MYRQESPVQFRLILSSLENLLSHVEEEKPTSVLLSDVDVDEIIMTFPMMMAALVAMISQFLVGMCIMLPS